MSKNIEINDEDIMFNNNINNINVEYIFLDLSKNIKNTINENIKLEKNNILEKNQLIKIIKKYLKNNDKEYNPYSILKYNIDIKSENIKMFIKYPIDFLKVINNIEDIKWEKCCDYLNKLNKLYLIYNEKNIQKIKNIKLLKTKKRKKEIKNNKIILKNKKTRKNKRKK